MNNDAGRNLTAANCCDKFLEVGYNADVWKFVKQASDVNRESAAIFIVRAVLSRGKLKFLMIFYIKTFLPYSGKNKIHIFDTAMSENSRIKVA